MRLYLEEIDTALELDALREDVLRQHLERKIGEYYNVNPVTSYKAWEDFKDGAGGVHRLEHVIFGVSARASGKQDNLALISTLYSHLWGQVRRAWPEGSIVMWRRRPAVTEDKKLKLITGTIRLGSISPLLPGVQTYQDSMALPVL